MIFSDFSHRHYLKLVREYLHPFQILFQGMQWISSTNAYKLYQMIDLLLLSYYSIRLWEDRCQLVLALILQVIVIQGLEFCGLLLAI